MKYATVLASVASMASAFPAVMQMSDAMLRARAADVDMAEAARLHERSLEEKRQLSSTPAAVAASKARKNCGVVPCLVFSATEQYVSTTGDHAYASPAADEIRGPCPGLNVSLAALDTRSWS